MLDQALDWGLCGWRLLESAWSWPPEPPQARIFLADPSEPGACEAVADSVEATVSSGLMALAVLKRERVAVGEHTLRQLQRIRQSAGLVVFVPRECSRKAVVWEGVLAPFMEDSSVCLTVDDLRGPAWRKASATVGCGWGATPAQAMVAAMADPALAALGAREPGGMLVALTLGNPSTLLQDVFGACKLLRAQAPHGRVGLSCRTRPSVGPLALVHLVAL